MNMLMTKQADGSYLPTYESDYEKSKKISVGETRKFSNKKSRNVRHHRKLFALFRLVLHYLPEEKKKEAFKNGFRFKTDDDVLFYCKIKMGHIRQRAVTRKGNIIYEPDSISFEKMGQDKFDDFYNQAVDICLKLMEADRQLIENELMNFM